MDNNLVLIIVTPLLAAFLILLFRPKKRLSEILAFIGIVFPAIIVIPMKERIAGGCLITQSIGLWDAPIGINLKMDGISFVITLITIFIWAASLLFMCGDKKCSCELYAVFLTLFAGSAGVLLTEDIFNMFVFFEIVSLCIFILVASTGEPIALRSSFKFLLISGLGISFFLLGIGLLYRQFGVLDLSCIAEKIKNADNKVVLAAFSMMIIGIGLRAAFVPIHIWLPDAHAYAPHFVSAVLSGIVIKIAFIAVWRLTDILDLSQLYYIFIWIGSIGAIFGVIKALAQDDIKKLIAYHSVSQMGFIIASFGVNTDFSKTACVVYIINHAVFKSLLFLCAGAVIYSTGNRKIPELSGLGRNMPLVGIATIVGVFSITGMPFFNGYISKLYVMQSLKDFPAPYWLILFAGIGTIASFLKLIYIFLGRCNEREIKPVPICAKISLVLLSGVSIAIGINPVGFSNLTSVFLNMKAVELGSVYSLNQFIIFIISAAAGAVILKVTRFTNIGNIFTTIFKRDMNTVNALFCIVISIVCMIVFLR